MTPTRKSPLPSRYLEASLLTQLPPLPMAMGMVAREGEGVPANLETGGHVFSKSCLTRPSELRVMFLSSDYLEASECQRTTLVMVI